VPKVVVTGAAGYVGGRLLAQFADRDVDVHAIGRERAPRLGVPETVCDLAGADAEQALRDACEGADVLVHLAGENEVDAARGPAAALASTIVATERVAEACAAGRVRRLVYISTVNVYGAQMRQGATLDEELRVEPRSPYAISRLASEHATAALATDAFELVVFRLTNCVGAPDDPVVDRWSLVANDLCREGAVHGRLTLRSSGTQWRDFVALSDVCHAIGAASGVGDVEVAPGTYNVGSGRPTTVRALATLIGEEFERQTGTRPPLHAPHAEPDPPRPYRVAVQRAAGQGLVLDTPLTDAVAETVEFCLRHRDELS
jgi:UDP-glucose 4-epimerase